MSLRGSSCLATEVAYTSNVHGAIVSGEISLCASDDGQKFGLPEPRDALASARNLICGKIIRGTTISKTSDLQILFEGVTILELINYSSGYEAWNASIFNAGSGSNLIALGGGQIAIFSDK